jgi:hypothetical protein
LNQHLTTDAKPSSQKHYRNSKRYIITAQRWSSKRQTGDSVSSSTQPFGGDDRAKSDYLDRGDMAHYLRTEWCTIVPVKSIRPMSP